MGGTESKLGGLEGYQIVRVMCNSPAHVAGFVAFFDFITAVDELHLDRDDPSFFFDYIRRNKDKAIKCQVFNLRVRSTREVVVVPTDCWGGVGLLGCNVCWESAERALDSTWHIVDVAKDGPAYHADLMAQRDYVLAMQPAADGSSITTFRDGSDFHSRIEEWRARMAVANRSTPRSLLLLVFDSVDNSVKEVLLDMSSSNSLGIDVANGYLHLVPPLPNPDRIPTMRRFVAAVPKVVHAEPVPPPSVTAVAAPQPLPPVEALRPRQESPDSTGVHSPTSVTLPSAAAAPTTAPVLSTPVVLQPPQPVVPLPPASASFPAPPPASQSTHPAVAFPPSSAPTAFAFPVPTPVAAFPTPQRTVPVFPSPPPTVPSAAHH